jgi:hypothetical protein
LERISASVFRRLLGPNTRFLNFETFDYSNFGSSFSLVLKLLPDPQNNRLITVTCCISARAQRLGRRSRRQGLESQAGSLRRDADEKRW